MTRAKSRLPQIPDRLAALVDPRLVGARCAGRSPLWDEELPDETPEARSARLAYAARICSGCPVLSACRTAAVEQDHPAGMWAGRLRNHNPQGYGRPRKDRSA
ncbi:WhiB family transcriptional regulator [Rhodococcus aetherivorans]|uniref:WhiB family transcriptional regulator n=1 Tax=Rhodococcus aetherivorans TaxID=191292 RepID=UPI00294A0361|nr:WhiB family transcriptional regulator [Rhodococcus aetherivorans]MDV6291498.1 WhiB family transcriptional regulator [Rhodococcus aetherivorans]